jgi:hypothetical protein
MRKDRLWQGTGKRGVFCATTVRVRPFASCKGLCSSASSFGDKAFPRQCPVDDDGGSNQVGDEAPLFTCSTRRSFNLFSVTYALSQHYGSGSMEFKMGRT